MGEPEGHFEIDVERTIVEIDGADTGYLVVNQLSWNLLGYPVYQMPMGFGFVRALPLFVLGMALAWFAQKVWISPKLAGWAGIGAALGLAVVQYFDKHALVSLTCISVIILAAGATPTPRPSKWVEKAAQVSFSMFITNEVVRIAWFGVANVVIARLGPPLPVQWAIWAAGDWWGDHPLSVQPLEDGLDRPQMVAIEHFIPRRTEQERTCEALRRR